MTLIHNSMIVSGILYCVHLVLFIFFHCFPLSFFFQLLLFIFSLIMYYMFSQNLVMITCSKISDPLSKILSKHCTLTNFFKGVISPWATLIPNSMIVVWVLYCVKLFLSYFFFLLPFLKSFYLFILSQSIPFF